MQTAQFTGALLGILKKRIEEDKLSLPILPTAADVITHSLNDAHTDLVTLTNIVEQDPVLTMQMLRVDRTENMARGIAADSILQACERLGVKKIKGVLGEMVKQRVFNTRVQGANLIVSGFCQHSLAVALLAQDIAGLTNCPTPDAAYVAGLLHDLGSIAVIIFLLEFEKTLYSKPMATKPEWLSLEGFWSIIKAIKAEVSTCMASKWPLADHVRKAIAGVVDYDVGERISIMNIVHFSNALSKRLGIYPGQINSEEIDALLMIGCSFLGLEKEMVDRLSAQLKHRLALSD